MNVKARRGQIFIIIIIILLGMIVLFALLPAWSSRQRSTPVVQQVFWQVSSQNVTTAFVNQEVEVHVAIKAAEEYVGSVTLKVRKDVAVWFDSDYTVKTFPVNLGGDQVVELKLPFVPDQASAGGLRGYFMEVDFLSKNTKWVMEDSYPPRLKVFQYEPGSNVPA
jgi:hypothetical protein